MSRPRAGGAGLWPGGQQGLHARAGDRHPGGTGAGRAGDGIGEGGQGGGAFGGVVADPLDVERLLAVKPISFSCGR